MADQESLENPSPVGLDSKDEVSKVFTHFDSNGDGKISKSEIASVVRALDSDVSPDELQAMMDEMDSDGDGFIDLNEFAAFHRRRSGGSGGAAVDEEVRDAFEMYDLDKNGLISTDELHLVLKKLGEKNSVGDCARMIRSVDADGDGSVNYEEFKKMMTNGSGGGGVAAVEEEGNNTK